jgi:hypothetical protein
MPSPVWAPKSPRAADVLPLLYLHVVSKFENGKFIERPDESARDQQAA